MRTAVDSSVLLDVFLGEPARGPAAKSSLEEAIGAGSLVACDVVWAEVGAHFSSPESFHRAMSELGVVFDPCDESCADLAAEAWRLYRRRGGSRLHLIPDFLVAAHALSRADRLLTRDRGFASRYFGALKIVEPGA